MINSLFHLHLHYVSLYLDRSLNCLIRNKTPFDTEAKGNSEMDGEIFKTENKKLRILKYPDMCGQGLREKNLLPSSHDRLLKTEQSHHLIQIIK